MSDDGGTVKGGKVDKIEILLNKIKVDENRNEQIIVFKEKKGERFLPVVIGMAEVNSIKLKLSGINPPRPLTHDLLLSTIQSLGSKVKYVVIDKLESNTFFAKLVVEQDGKERWIDARPSDSVALALRAGAPIFVAEDILEQASLS